METHTLISILALSTAGSFIQRVCGFGFGIFIMTILPYLMPTYPEATALSGLLSLIQSSIVLATVWQHLRIRNLIGIFAAFTITSYLAIRLVGSSGDTTLKTLLGIALIALAAYFILFSSQARITPHPIWQATLGSISGIMGGLFGMHGPAAVVYFLSSEPTKLSYLAICQAYFVLTNIYMTIFRTSHGFITHAVIQSLLWALPGIAIGIYIGQKIFNRIPQHALRKIIYIYMIFAGIAAIIS